MALMWVCGRGPFLMSGMKTSSFEQVYSSHPTPHHVAFPGPLALPPGDLKEHPLPGDGPQGAEVCCRGIICKGGREGTSGEPPGLSQVA